MHAAARTHPCLAPALLLQKEHPRFAAHARLSCSKEPPGLLPQAPAWESPARTGTGKAAGAGGSTAGPRGLQLATCGASRLAGSPLLAAVLPTATLRSGLLPPAENGPGEMAPGTGRQLRRAHSAERGALACRSEGTSAWVGARAAPPEGLPARSSPQQEHVRENSPRAARSRVQRPRRVTATGWGPRSSEAGISSWNGYKACP